jgi:hypothetical protein
MPWQLIPLEAVRPQWWQSTGSAAGPGGVAVAVAVEEGTPAGLAGEGAGPGAAGLVIACPRGEDRIDHGNGPGPA